MGGAQAGEVASKTAADAFDRDLPEIPPERFLRETIEEANRRIHELARADPSRAGMGTTITAVIVDAQKEEVGIGHVGDSRAYPPRRGRGRAGAARAAHREVAARAVAHHRDGADCRRDFGCARLWGLVWQQAGLVPRH